MLNTTQALEHEATEIGRVHGFNHANYVDAYGGDMDEAPVAPLRFADVATYYAAGYTEGVEEYRDQASDNCCADYCGLHVDHEGACAER